MNASQQEGKYHHEVVHNSSLIVMEDAPERHESKKNRARPLLPKDVTQVSRPRCVRQEHCWKEKRCKAEEDCHASEKTVDKEIYLLQ